MERYLGLASVIILILAVMVAYLAFTRPSEDDIRAKLQKELEKVQEVSAKEETKEPKITAKK